MRHPKKPPSKATLSNLLTSLDQFERIYSAIPGPCHNGKYLHWDEIWNRSAPSDLSHEEWWLGLTMKRTGKAIPLTGTKGGRFTFGHPEEAQELLHNVTQRASGTLAAPDLVTNEETRNQYVIRNLMEEGITSSLIEGASTTREEAKKMLRTESKPKNEGEQMVYNNYRAMQYIIDLGQTTLTREIVFELHEIITRDTLDDPTASGRLRRDDERIQVVDPRDNEILHTPPPAKELTQRMKAMCRFANGETPEGFVHPVVRSILLHFWLAYDHPFKDGNGRCARALFYWSMLQHDYWLCQFISISTFIVNAPVQYMRAFLFTETDDNDLTYFLLHQLRIINRAIDELYQYLEDKLRQRREIESRLRLGTVLNGRQLDIIGHALRHPNARYDIKQHQTKFDVVYQTARTDLLELADKGLLVKGKTGKSFYFIPVGDLEHALESLQA